MVSRRPFSYAYWVLALFGVGLAAASCTSILGIDTGHEDNVCTQQGGVLEPLKCGAGACSTLVPACDANGLPVLECPPVNKTNDTDTCGDGIDNDCDGLVDENDIDTCTCTADQLKNCYSGSPGTRAKGLCSDGFQNCDQGTWGICQGDTLPEPEIADGFDNNCDGAIDEGLGCSDGEEHECYGGAIDTIGKGPCKKGKQTCKNGKWGECQGEQLPAAIDTCNGFDDDCDGNVDNIGQTGSLCDCVQGDTKNCYVNESGEAIDCPSDLQGECKCGTMTCGSNQKYGPCIGATKPTTDICDFKDNDCNGVVDNIGLPNTTCECGFGDTQPCYTGPAGSEGVGPCQAGERTCDNGKFGPCIGEVVPKATDTCDGVVDDDCNGNVDNINIPGSPCECITNSTDVCFTGPPEKLNVGACKAGQRSCVNGKWGLCTGQTLPGVELCDGLDNDCNGGVDDGIPGVGDSCFLSEYANTPCYVGKIECPLGKTQPECVPSTKPGFIPEKCDGIDNNCNLIVDDGFFCCPNDGKISGNETDLDCGGSCPAKCADSQSCIVGIDCQSGNCFQNQCKSATCSDGLKNGAEADVDCGEVCPNKCIVGKSCGGDNDCISNLCQPASKTCIQKPKGSACLADAECSTGFCVDNVCCGSDCTGECQACTASKKGSGLDGDCGAIATNTDPDNECQTALPTSCGNTGVCSGASSCAKYALGTECAPAACTNGNTENPADICDGQGNCIQKFDQACSTGYSCVGGACKTTCTTNGECASGYFCNAPTCQIKKNDGDSCSNAAQCASGNCVDGVCCNTICTDTCKACNIPGSLGTCSPLAANSDPLNECNPGSCDGLGQCQKTNGSSCASPDQCVNGNCVDGVCCNTSCVGTCVSCAVMGSVGSCSNIPANTDPASECTPGDCSGTGDCQDVVGISCTMPSDCASGFCVDGYCCDTACAGTCEACSGAIKGAGANGVCGPINVGLDPNNECSNGSCDGAKSCQLPNGGACMANAQCASGHCVDGVCCNQTCGGICQACNVQNNVGTCVSIPANTDPTNECNPGSCDGLGQCQVGTGASCSNANQCTTGFCVDGVCCDSICSGLCQACTTALKGGGNNGECGSIVAGQDPQNECDQEPTSTCGKTGTCNGAGACAVYANGTVCNSATCSGNTVVLSDKCNGAGVCQDGGTMSCGSYSCNAGSCLSTCTSDAQCASGNYCNTLTNVCVLKLSQGTVCSGNNQCASGFCVDGYCCDSACTGECKSCSVAGTLGTCTNVPSGQTDTSPSCQGVQVCNGSGKCVDTNGQPCSINTECFSQSCVDQVCCENGCGGTCMGCSNAKTGQTAGLCRPISSGTDPDNECSGATACDGMGTCAKLGNGAPCAGNAECSSNFCVDGVCCENACTGVCKACSASRTGGANGSCLNIATNTDPDNECAAGECSALGACELANGIACGSSAECASGACVDNVCCNNACSGDCQSCNQAGSVGTCKAITSGQDTCGAGSVCDASGTCKKLQGEACGTGAECLSNFCVDGVCCASACNGLCQACSAAKTGSMSGTCGNITTNTDPDNECAAAAVCSTGTCVKPNGEACGGGGECLSGHCTDGVCCDTTCTGNCKACDNAGSVGTCSNIPTNTDPDNECAGTGVCNGSGVCVKGNGDTCSMGTDCASGFCVDGVCCENACSGTCQSCSLAKTGQANGLCRATQEDTDPENECTGASPIGCNGAGACQVIVGGSCGTDSQCGSGFCADGVCCNSACSGTCVSCNQMAAQGTCTNVPANQDPANECNPGECDGSGACELANGLGCTMDAQCGSGFCVDGFCCESACNGTCMSCSNVKTGQTSGVCAPTLEDTDPENECTGASAIGCDGAGACQIVIGGGCGADSECGSNFCADGVCCNSACSGTCFSCNQMAAQGTCTAVPADTDPADECSVGDCNGAGACELATGSGCTLDTQCASGFCVDSFCCNNACSGTCEACAATKTGGADGTCGNVLANTDPDMECTTECSGSGVCEAADGAACMVNADCQSNYCNGSNVCATPNCMDGVKNGTETDVDCGGSCAACKLLLLVGKGANPNPVVVGSFPPDSPASGWTTATISATFLSTDPALTMPKAGLGVGLVRDTNNSNRARYITWDAVAGWGSFADMAGPTVIDNAPSLASGGGLAHAVYRKGTTKEVLYSAFNGTAWSPSNTLARALTTAVAGVTPDIAALSSGTAFVGTLDLNVGHDIYVHASTDFATAVNIRSSVTSSYNVEIAGLTNGELVATYVAAGTAIASRWRNTAGAWQTEATITSANLATGSRMSLAPLPNGDAILVWKNNADGKPYFSIFSSATHTWGTAAQIVNTVMSTNGTISVTRGMGTGIKAEVLFVETGSNLMHARWNGSTWTALQVGAISGYSNVAIAAPPP